MFVNADVAKRIAMGVAMGAQFIGSLVGGLALGWFVDEKVKTDPIGLFIGLCLGLTVGIFLLIQAGKKEEENPSED
jgi:F0F1-type ATP synthase assembly protein I